jgi:uncharacterized membrane protein YkvA (DUF1232 family)
MEWWEILLIAVLGTMAALLLAALILWRMATKRTKRLAGRIGALPWRHKLELARALMRDDRIPVYARIVPPLLVLYLALPLDIVPDFIPVIGQLDDIVVLAVGVALLVKLTPARVLDEHLARLEGDVIEVEGRSESGEQISGDRARERLQ